MSQGQPLPASTILLIEADPSLRRLIMLGLFHDGMHVIEASSVQSLPALDVQEFDLLIVDVDQGVKSDWSLLTTLREQACFAALPIVALSWENTVQDKVSLPASLFSSLPFLSPRPTSSAGSSASSVLSNVTCLSKPFDARALHSTISKLLAERAARKAAQIALIEAQVLASYEQRAAPSIWPVVTAAGLLLVVTGFLLQFLIAIVGMVLMVTALFLWMLGTKPSPSVSSSPIATISTVSNVSPHAATHQLQ